MNNYNRFNYFIYINLCLTLLFISAIYVIGLLYLKSNIISEYYPFITISLSFLFLVQYKLQLIIRKLTWFNSFRILFSWLLVFVITTFVLFLFKESESYSRIVISITFSIMSFANIALIKIFLYLNKHYFRDDKKILIIGDNKENIANYLSERNYFNFFFLDSKDFRSSKHFIEKNKIDSVILSPGDDISILSDLISELQYSFANVYLVSPYFLKTNSSFLKYFDINFKETIKLIPLNIASINSSFSGPFFKRCIDIILSIIFIIILLPLFIIISLMIKLESKGPIFFRQERIGMHREKFSIFKFRSMYLHNAKDIIQAHQGDSRITKVGKFIRKTSIDELPQLFNVLIGNMSLVGPRPHATQHDNKYSKEIIDYISRLKVKPGITGLAQIMGYRGETKELSKMEQRIKYDISYIQEWSLLLDILIILYTPYILIKNKAY